MHLPLKEQRLASFLFSFSIVFTLELLPMAENNPSIYPLAFLSPLCHSCPSFCHPLPFFSVPSLSIHMSFFFPIFNRVAYLVLSPSLALQSEGSLNHNHVHVICCNKHGHPILFFKQAYFILSPSLALQAPVVLIVIRCLWRAWISITFPQAAYFPSLNIASSLSSE